MGKTLYITDLDGTLLNTRSEISQKSLTMLNQALADGALISIATGRCLASTKRAVSHLKLKLPWITNNGALIHCPLSDELMVSHTVDMEVASYVLAFGRNKPYKVQMATLDEQGVPHFYYNETYNDSIKNQVSFYKDTGLRRPVKVSHFDKALSEKIIALQIRDSKEHLKDLKEHLESIFELSIYFSPCWFDPSNYLLEIHHAHVTKGHGVNHLKYKLQQTYGVDVDCVICFGDEFNDASMFKVVDVACAMENASSEIRQLAHQILESNDDDAVAKFITNDFYKN